MGSDEADFRLTSKASTAKSQCFPKFTLSHPGTKKLEDELAWLNRQEFK
jgi:hypothetical protein